MSEFIRHTNREVRDIWNSCHRDHQPCASEHPYVPV